MLMLRTMPVLVTAVEREYLQQRQCMYADW
jgi:hypothetical protein